MSRKDTYYCVNGFRSLLGFKINLTQGINILVGPNGSGKTNFIEFLDFMDALIRGGASNAVSQSGGVARVFSIENFKKGTPTLDCEIFGVASISEPEFSESELRYFNFKYYIEIKFSKKNSQIYISKEKIQIFKLFGDFSDNLGAQRVGSLSVRRSDISEFVAPVIDVGRRLYSEHQRNPLSLRRRLHRNRKLEELFDRMELQTIEPDQSLLQNRRLFPAIDAIRQAITRGKSFNIIPEKARIADHISRYPLIERDGAGLSSVLYNLKKLKSPEGGKGHPILRDIPRDSFDMVVNWTSLIFPELSDIIITQDLHAGKYMVQLSVNRQKGVRIPLQAASDGTIKWLALVSLVVSTGGMGCLEEPENFLHPKMQIFLMDLLRENGDPESKSGYFILSTHSETIINNSRPEELVIFNFSDIGTSCRRVRNPQKVRDEINKTGFGLGYYYAANSL